MAGAEACAIVAVEIFVEEDEVAPMGILLELPGSSVHRPASILVLEEDASQPAREFLSYLIERHASPRTGGTLDGERVAVVHVVLEQGSDDQRIHGHPDRPPPVG